MNEQNKSEMTWWERNKKKVLIIGGVVVAVGIGVVVFKNKDILNALVTRGKTLVNNIPQIGENMVIETTSEIITVVDTEAVTVSKPLNNGLPFGVNGFVRNLPDGCHPSAEKIAQAEALGINLGDHQTIVNSYMKNVA